MRERVVINDHLSLARTANGPRYVCTCGQELAPQGSNFKYGCRVKESPLGSLGSGFRSFAKEIEDKMCFREFFCPRCGARLASEVARRGDDYLFDIDVRL
ncbi:MAG: acetone carboxylase subunit gamma [Thermoleophilia bacterium]|nr:acetone carboxylase subunit gamma [Thermoleophilia bacterium]